MKRRTLGSWLTPKQLSVPILLFLSAASAGAQPVITDIVALDSHPDAPGQGQQAIAQRGWAKIYGEGVAAELGSFETRAHVFVNDVETLLSG